MKILIALASLGIALPVNAQPPEKLEDYSFRYGYAGGSVMTLCVLVNHAKLITSRDAKAIMEGYIETVEDEFKKVSIMAIESAKSDELCNGVFD